MSVGEDLPPQASLPPAPLSSPPHLSLSLLLTYTPTSVNYFYSIYIELARRQNN